jgi:hypothetical protein
LQPLAAFKSSTFGLRSELPRVVVIPAFVQEIRNGAPRAAGNIDMGRRALSQWLLFGMLLFLVTLLLAEFSLRVVGRVDEDDNFFLGSRLVSPRSLPVNRARRFIMELHEHPSSYHQYHERLGWTVRPSSQSIDGRYRANPEGLRAAPGQGAFGSRPTDGRRRVALFGDSFVHGDEVEFDDSIGAQLETQLGDVEVLNFGVGGYGMDQAYLRWHEQGRRFHPNIVVFGFQPGNLVRNVNLVRSIYFPQTGLAFAKPRFVIEGGALRLINIPTPRPEDLPQLLSRFEEWPLSRYEAYYSPTWYRASGGAESRVLRVARWVWRGSSDPSPREQLEPLAELIIERFAAEVKQSGGTFVIVHIPTWQALDSDTRAERLSYGTLLGTLKGRFVVIDPLTRLREVRRVKGTAALRAGGHFSGLANGLIAEELAEALNKRR